MQLMEKLLSDLHIKNELYHTCLSIVTHIARLSYMLWGKIKFPMHCSIFQRWWWVVVTTMQLA